MASFLTVSAGFHTVSRDRSGTGQPEIGQNDSSMAGMAQNVKKSVNRENRTFAFCPDCKAYPE